MTRQEQSESLRDAIQLISNRNADWDPTFPWVNTYRGRNKTNRSGNDNFTITSSITSSIRRCTVAFAVILLFWRHDTKLLTYWIQQNIFVYYYRMSSCVNRGAVLVRFWMTHAKSFQMSWMLSSLQSCWCFDGGSWPMLESKVSCCELAAIAVTVHWDPCCPAVVTNKTLAYSRHITMDHLVHIAAKPDELLSVVWFGFIRWTLLYTHVLDQLHYLIIGSPISFTAYWKQITGQLTKFKGRTCCWLSFRYLRDD